MAQRRTKDYRELDGNQFMRISFGPVPEEVQVDEWVRLQKLYSWEQKKDTFVLTFDANEKNYTLTMAAPRLGGIRIYSEQEGFFKPEKLAAPIFEEREDTVCFFGVDGTKAVVSAGEDWSICFYDKNDVKQFRITKDSFLIGYKCGVPERVKFNFDIEPDELLFGLGERFSGLNQNGNRHFFWNTDCGYLMDCRGLELWRSYKNIPLLHSDRGYTLFFDSFYPAISDMGYTEENQCVWDFWGPTLDLFLWTGELKERLTSYLELTGKPFLPPKWAFRYMSGGGNAFWYGEDWGNGNIPENYLAILRDVMEGYQKLGTPHVAALYGEGWIADHPEAYKILNANGVRMLRWNPPDYSEERMKANLPGVSDFDLPNVKDVNEPKQKAGDYIDFFNPNAKKLIKNILRDNFEMGLRGGMLDFAEMVPDNALYCNGMTGREMHNFNPYWYTKVYGEATREIIGDDFLYYCRGGCAGSQRWAGTFSGDQEASLEGLREQLNSALSLALCGFSAWGGDLAGYEGKPNEETFIRGMQFATFQPLMRAHGTRTRCPWEFGKLAEQVYKKYYWLRENLVNLLYSSAILAHETGMPMMKAMVLAYPSEKNMADNETQYLFCDTILTAPVFEENAKTKQVDFPTGTWYELLTGNVVKGSVRKDVEVSLTDCPAYLKAGSVIIARMNSDLEWAAAFEEETMAEVMVVTPSDGSDISQYAADTEHRIQFENSLDGRNVVIKASQGISYKNFVVYGDVEKVTADGQEIPYELLSNYGKLKMSRIKLSGSDNQVQEIVFSLKDFADA